MGRRGPKRIRPEGAPRKRIALSPDDDVRRRIERAWTLHHGDREKLSRYCLRLLVRELERVEAAELMTRADPADPIDEHLPSSLVKLLRDHGIEDQARVHTIGELIHLDRDTLLGWPGIGEHILSRLEEALSRVGHLLEDPHPADVANHEE